MAIVQQYPLKTPKNSDLLVGTSIPDPNTNDDPKTSSFSVSSIGSFLITENNIITGGGTLNTIPMFTPDGQIIGDSIINQKPNGLEIQVGTGGGAQQTTLGSTYIFAGALGGDVVTATNINGGNTGNVILSGGVIIGNEATDVLQITSAVSDYTGSSSTSAGQVLLSTASGQLAWADAPSGPDAVVNTPDTYLSPKVRYIISLTQGEYDAIVTPDVNTLYIII